MKTDYTVRVFQASDKERVIALIKETFSFSTDLWTWKHLSYPNFTPSSIILAEKEGRIIGTSSWIPRELKISTGLTIKSALGGDTAVASDYRGQGVGTNIMKFFYKELTKNEVLITTGFATPQVARKFYAPLGSILMRDSTTNYLMYLNCNQWKKKILLADEESEAILRRELGEKEFSIKFDLHGAPPFRLAVKQGKISLDECSGSPVAETNVTIRAELSSLTPFFQGEKGVLDLLKLLIRRKIKTKGFLRNSMTLFHVFKAIRPLFRD